MPWILLLLFIRGLRRNAKRLNSLSTTTTTFVRRRSAHATRFAVCVMSKLFLWNFSKHRNRNSETKKNVVKIILISMIWARPQNRIIKNYHFLSEWRPAANANEFDFDRLYICMSTRPTQTSTTTIIIQRMNECTESHLTNIQCKAAAPQLR